MIAPSICKSEAVSRNIRAICLLSMPRLYSSLPEGSTRFSLSSWGTRGTAIPGCALGFPLLCDLSVLSALCVNSSLRLLLSDRCYLLSPLPWQLTNLPVPQQKNGGSSRPRRYPDPNSLSGAFFYLGRLRSFGSLYYLEFDRITLLQAPVTISGDCRIVYEYIGPIFPAYESVSFRIIEPLHCSLHFVSPLDGDSGGGKHRRRHEHELRGVYQNGMLSQARTNNFLTSLCIFILALIGSTAIGPEGYRKKVR